MPDLSFAIEGAEAVPYAAAPMLALEAESHQTPAGSDRFAALCCNARFRSKPRAGHTPRKSKRAYSTFTGRRSAGARLCAPRSGRTPRQRSAVHRRGHRGCAGAVLVRLQCCYHEIFPWARVRRSAIVCPVQRYRVLDRPRARVAASRRFPGRKKRAIGCR